MGVKFQRLHLSCLCRSCNGESLSRKQRVARVPLFGPCRKKVKDRLFGGSRRIALQQRHMECLGRARPRCSAPRPWGPSSRLMRFASAAAFLYDGDFSTGGAFIWFGIIFRTASDQPREAAAIAIFESPWRLVASSGLARASSRSVFSARVTISRSRVSTLHRSKNHVGRLFMSCSIPGGPGRITGLRPETSTRVRDKSPRLSR